jgi:hypothetical protein
LRFQQSWNRSSRHGHEEASSIHEYNPPSWSFAF